MNGYSVYLEYSVNSVPFSNTDNEDEIKFITVTYMYVCTHILAAA